jgi:hypothetical protein
LTPGDAGPALRPAAVGDGADTGGDAIAARGSRPDGTRQPLCIAVVGAEPAAVRRLSRELEKRINRITGLKVHRDRRAEGQDAAAAPSAEVMIFETLPAPRTSASLCGRDLVLLCLDSDDDGRAVDTGRDTRSPRDGQRSTAAYGSEDHWRERLIDVGVDWCAVGGPAGDAVEQAMDALAPLLRVRSHHGTGLFTRLAERNAQQAARLWRCADCDDPDCEHALRSTRSSRHAIRPD